VQRGLVRPHQPLPKLIQRITGLRDRDVADVSRLEEVRYRVAAALEGRVLIAHNAEFERSFLTRFVAPELKSAVFLDTQDLFALTHPDAPDLRLASFTRILLGREERHRAFDDALDTAQILAAITRAAALGEERYATARRALDRYAPESPWLQLLHGPLAIDDAVTRDQFIPIAASKHDPVPFDEDAIAKVLADEARGREYFPGYRVREEQIELARHFVRNLEGGGTLLLEGGTGVGKSLAYLAAAIPFALERRSRGVRGPVVISTRTKLLQDQLLRKDIAAAARFLGYPELRALSIKGRANYVCERRRSGCFPRSVSRTGFCSPARARDPTPRSAISRLLCCDATRACAICDRARWPGAQNTVAARSAARRRVVPSVPDAALWRGRIYW